jgi:hypothetical protein
MRSLPLCLFTILLSLVVVANESGKSSVVDVVSIATARLCKAKTCHASVFATHDLTVAHFWKQAMSASECILKAQDSI